MSSFLSLFRALLPAVSLLAVLFAGGTAGAAETLTVYTYDSFVSKWGPGPKIKAAFEADCGCTLDLVGLEDGAALLSRLMLEGKNTKADIVLGLDTNLMVEAKATGLLAAHGQDLGALTLPMTWTDDVFVPYDYGYFAVVYDTQAIKTPPASLKQLVEGPRDQKIIIQDPRSSTPGLGLLLWVQSVYGADAPRAWAKLKGRVLTVTKGWSEAYGLFTKGEAPMVLSYTTSPAYHMEVEGTDRYQAASFAEGHYMQVEVAARTATSQNPDLAKRFMAFMLSPGFQNVIPASNWMFPAAATSEPLPGAFAKLVQPTRSLLMAPEEVAGKRAAWVYGWLRGMSR